MDDNICHFKKCKDKVEVNYLGKNLCDKHWAKLCEKTPEECKKILEIKEKK